MVGEFPALDVIYSFLFLIPGFLSFKIVSFFKAHQEPLDSFEKTAWSLLASGIALSGSYLIVGASKDKFPANINPVLFARLFTYSLILSFVVGIFTTIIYKKYIEYNPHTPRGNAWQYLAIQTPSEKVRVSIITQENIELAGSVTFFGTLGKNDILINDPVVVKRGQDINGENMPGEEGEIKVKDSGEKIRMIKKGRAAYVPEEEIARLYLLSPLSHSGEGVTFLGVLKRKKSLRQYLLYKFGRESDEQNGKDDHDSSNKQLDTQSNSSMINIFWNNFSVDTRDTDMQIGMGIMFILLSVISGVILFTAPFFPTLGPFVSWSFASALVSGIFTIIFIHIYSN
ncbi:hypothetical protein [Haladaptatus sp. DFWS20]|uniref:hypothetical protein n=1 Tax=Haladaptatus sp. DFWS20 TaxID=3403467 RepID=UPI003EBD6E73